MMDENGMTDFRKGVIYGERLERARIIALLKTYVEKECDEHCEWNCECFAKYEAYHFINLIKGETK